MNFILNRLRMNDDDKRMDYIHGNITTSTSLLTSSSTMTQRKDLLLSPKKLQQQEQLQEQLQSQQQEQQQQQQQAPNQPQTKKRNRKRIKNKNKTSSVTKSKQLSDWKYNIICILLSKTCFRSIIFILVLCYLLLSIFVSYRIMFHTRVGNDIQNHIYQSMEYYTPVSSTTNLSLAAIQLFQDIYNRTTNNMNYILKDIDIDVNSLTSSSSSISAKRPLVQYGEHQDICYGCLYETYDLKYKIKTCFMGINELMSQHAPNNMSFMDASINISYIHPNYCQRCDPNQCQQQQQQQEGEGGNVITKKQHEKKFYRIDDIMTNTYMIHDAKTYRLLDSPLLPYGIHNNHRIPWNTLNNPNQLTQYIFNPKHLYPHRKYFYEYNPSIILLPIHQRPTKDSIYLMSFRVSTNNKCLMKYDDLIQLLSSYTPNNKNYHEDHLGLAILNEHLEIISQTVVNYMKISRYKSNFQDPRLFILRNQIYIGSYHVINPIWLVPPSSEQNDDIDKQIYQVDGQNSTFEESAIILSYYYPDGLNSSNTNNEMMKVYVRKARSCHTLGIEQYGGKNINYFVDNIDRIIIELYPLSGKEVLNVNVTCKMKSRYDVQSNNSLMESSNQINSIYPVRSYGTSDELQYVQQNIDYKPYTNELGSICCLNVRYNNQNLFLGISHNKIASMNKKVPRNMTNNYYSTFYVMENMEPYNVIARSGRFCLGYPIDLLKETTSTKSTIMSKDFLEYKYPRLYNDPLIVGNDTYTKCPKILYITGMTEQYNNTNNIILSYGIDDCISRIVIIKKSKILQLIFNPHDDLLLLSQ